MCVRVCICRCVCVYGYGLGRTEKNKAFDQRVSPCSYGSMCGHKDSNWLLQSTLQPSFPTLSIVKSTAFCFVPHQPLLLEKTNMEKAVTRRYSLHSTVSSVHRSACCFGMTPPGEQAIVEQPQESQIQHYRKLSLRCKDCYRY